MGGGLLKELDHHCLFVSSRRTSDASLCSLLVSRRTSHVYASAFLEEGDAVAVAGVLDHVHIGELAAHVGDENCHV